MVVSLGGWGLGPWVWWWLAAWLGGDRRFGGVVVVGYGGGERESGREYMKREYEKRNE